MLIEDRPKSSRVQSLIIFQISQTQIEFPEGKFKVSSLHGCLGAGREKHGQHGGILPLLLLCLSECCYFVLQRCKPSNCLSMFF